MVATLPIVILSSEQFCKNILFRQGGNSAVRWTEPTFMVNHSEEKNLRIFITEKVRMTILKGVFVTGKKNKIIKISFIK